MFTGIIQAKGTVVARGKNNLKVAGKLRGLKAGDSVAVSGACLTVTPPVKPGVLAFAVSDETWSRTSLGSLAAGSPVNLEPALRAGDPLGGHIVSGHVDATGRVFSVKKLPEGFMGLRISLPRELRGLVALKGSIAVDGVSLTVTAAGHDFFETVLVPHTLDQTTLGARKPGDPVNLEADLIARYVAAALFNRIRSKPHGL